MAPGKIPGGTSGGILRKILEIFFGGIPGRITREILVRVLGRNPEESDRIVISSDIVRKMHPYIFSKDFVGK